MEQIYDDYDLNRNRNSKTAKSYERPNSKNIMKEFISERIASYSNP